MFIKNLHFIFLSLLISACTPKPKQIKIGHDQCDYCRMVITDKPFASQLLNRHGKAFFFDSIECLAAFELKGTVKAEDIHSKWVPDFNTPSNWIEVKNAHILKSERLRSPMGLNLSAYTDVQKLMIAKSSYGGEALSWDQVKNVVHRQWIQRSSSSGMGHK